MQALRPKMVLSRTEHRPYPMPAGPWVLFMSWHDLLFMHWPVHEEALRSLIPPALHLDTFGGSAWLSVTPFRMTGVRPRFLPSVPPLSNFPELNVRTYVTAGGKPGIWFFSLDAGNPVAVRLARATFHLPYLDAEMSCAVVGDEVHYRSVRTDGGTPGAELAARYRPVGEPSESRPGTLEHFLTERYCLYAADSRGNVYRGDIHHHPWPLRPAEAEVEKLTMTEQIGVALPETGPVLHFSERLDVLAWSPRRITLPG
ncbi:MAG: YqjF family protein [Rubrobacteraceae bacterium]